MAISDVVNIGVVGLGPRSGSWLPLLHRFPQCRVVAVCDRREPPLERALAEHAGRDIKGYREFGDMLAHPGLDAVVVLTDADTQVALAVQAMEAGKDVTTEVPACYSIEDCWRLVLAVERTGRIYQLAEQVRYWGFIQAWKQIVQTGQLGKIIYVEGEYVGYYGTRFFFQDNETGQLFTAEDAVKNPRAQKTWRHKAHPIGYLPHTLSPLLSILDDRVLEVTGMGTRPNSYFTENLELSDIEVALMKTEKDTIMRVMAGFNCPVGPRGETHHHFYQVRGTSGAVEWKRSGWDKAKMWLHNHQMGDWAAMPWSTDVIDAPPEARDTGHGGADYYALSTWLHAVQHRTQPPLDVYLAVETAAPAIAAGVSIERGSVPIKVPDFRPGPGRAAGADPASWGI